MDYEKLILASSSPRRKELLSGAGYMFESVVPSDREFTREELPELNSAELASLNAKQKCLEVSARFPSVPVLGADTVVDCQGRMMGKPSGQDEAREMLRFLSAKTHTVITACCLQVLDKKLRQADVTRSYVRFHELGDQEIEAYLTQVHVLDKAGAYAMQEKGEMIVEKFEGSMSNIIGLPMETIAPWLDALGIKKFSV